MGFNMLGGARPDKILKGTYSGLELFLMTFLLGLFILFVKAYIFQYCYNQIWPLLVRNNGENDRYQFKPLTMYEALIVVLLVMALF